MVFGLEYEYHIESAVDVAMWYNPHIRLWEIWFEDAEGNQVSSCHYAYGKKNALKEFHQMRADINLE